MGELSTKRRRCTRGFTILELMVAMTLLAVGLLALMVLIMTAIVTNNRSKLDTGGTLASQIVIEQFLTRSSTDNSNVTVYDCLNNAYTLATAAGNGAALDSVGRIDFTQAYADVPSLYKMRYITCGANGVHTTFDVRWNVANSLDSAKLITVSARQIGATNNLRLFSMPVTLRSIRGGE